MAMSAMCEGNEEQTLRKGVNTMAIGIAFKIRVRERKEIGDVLFGCLKASTEWNMHIADMNKKAATRERDGKANEGRTTGSVETATE